MNSCIQMTIAPGAITTVPRGKKDHETAKASITAENANVKVDPCMVPVAVRF